MPRPVPPPPVDATIAPEKLERVRRLAAKLGRVSTRKELALTLGLAALPAEPLSGIQDAVISWHLCDGMNKHTTVGTSKTALDHLIRVVEKAIETSSPGDRAKATRVMQRYVQPKSGLAYWVRDQLDRNGATPSPTDVLADARALRAELMVHPYVDPKVEAVRIFATHINGIFRKSVAPGFVEQDDPEDCASKWWRFARAVIKAGDVMLPDHYFDHPARFHELLSIDPPLA